MNRNKISILKSGSIYFFCRPKIKSKEEVQRFFFVLSNNINSYTSLVVGKKKLPKDSHESYFLFVEEANKNKQELLESLQKKHHKVGKGETTDYKAYCLAEGKFVITNHNNHTHFIYQITNPFELKEVQQEFNLRKEDDYLIFIKNPEFGTMIKRKKKINYPKDLQEKFSNYKFISLDPAFLDYKGVELLLINKESKNLTEKEKELQNCLEQISQEDLNKEFSKIISSKNAFSLSK
jgi:hypothetical protein